MTLHQLTLVSEREESAASRAQRLMEEARLAASEQIGLLEEALCIVAKLSAEVAVGGDIYPVGIRDLCKKMADDAVWCAQTCASILKNTSVFVPHREPLSRAPDQPVEAMDDDLVDI